MRGAGSGQNGLIMLLIYLFIFAWIKNSHRTKSRRYKGDSVKSFILPFPPPTNPSPEGPHFQWLLHANFRYSFPPLLTQSCLSAILHFTFSLNLFLRAFHVGTYGASSFFKSVCI